MPAFITLGDESALRAALGDAGARILRGEDDLEEVMTQVLGSDQLERGRIVAEPPSDELAAAVGMGAWHVNSASECHSIVAGDGIVEFITAAGPIAVRLGPGDVMVVQGAEHRYRPLTPQEWILRYTGDDLGAVETGRISGPWPGIG